MSVPQTDMCLASRICDGCKAKFITREAFDRRLCSACEKMAAELLAKVNATPAIHAKVITLD